MYNFEVINAIETIANLEELGEEFPCKELELAVVNCDYYVRPGRQRKAFIAFFEHIISGNFNYSLIDPNIPDDYRILMILIGLVRTFFDRSYFEERIKMPTEKINNTRLKEFVKKFSQEKLKNFFRIIITGRLECDLFISNAKSVNMWKKINDECRKLDSSIPSIRAISDDYSDFTKENPIYFFDYLDTEKIVNIICDHIDNHCDIAEKIANILCDSGYNAAHNYLMKLSK